MALLTLGVCCMAFMVLAFCGEIRDYGQLKVVILFLGVCCTTILLPGVFFYGKYERYRNLHGSGIIAHFFWFRLWLNLLPRLLIKLIHWIGLLPFRFPRPKIGDWKLRNFACSMWGNSCFSIVLCFYPKVYKTTQVEIQRSDQHKVEYFLEREVFLKMRNEQERLLGFVFQKHELCIRFKSLFQYLDIWMVRLIDNLCRKCFGVSGNSSCYFGKFSMFLVAATNFYQTNETDVPASESGFLFFYFQKFHTFSDCYSPMHTVLRQNSNSVMNCDKSSSFIRWELWL